jgi:hypothetical protein
MKRLEHDTTAPRRLTLRRRTLQPRPEDAGVAEEAELARAGWAELARAARDEVCRLGRFP